ncbi:MAG: ATP-binding protein [Planctomycetota bacterium]
MVTDDRPGTGLREQYTIFNRREDVARVESALMGAIEELKYDDATRFAVRLAFEECIANAFKHGNRGDDSKPVTIECDVQPAMIEIEVTDQGPGFDPDAVPDPTQDENLEIPAGRGLLLMRAYMTSVDIMPPGNKVRMRYERK